MPGDDAARPDAPDSVPRHPEPAGADALPLRPPLSGSPLAPLLDLLERSLRERGAPVAAALRPGLEGAHVEALLSDAGVPPRPELVAWWTWHDGAGPGRQADSELVESWHLLRLEDALALRRGLAESYADAGAPDRWPPSWQPLLAFDGAPVLCVDGETGSVHVEDNGFPDPAPPQFSSVEELVGTVLRAVDEDVTAQRAGQDPDLRRLWWW